MSSSDPAARISSLSNRDSGASARTPRHRWFRDARAVAILALAALFAACGSREPGPPLHYAFLPFENLSGDSSLDWVSRGASEFLSRSLRGVMASPGAAPVPGGANDIVGPDAVARANQTLGARPASAPGASAARSGAMIAGANHIVTGYVERIAAGVRITASEEDVATHKTGRTLSATAASPFEALNKLAHEFSAQAGPAAATNTEAFRLYCIALGEPTSGSTPLLERALVLDPDFGRAWIALARVTGALGDHAAASRVIAQARIHKLAPLDVAWLDFEEAALGGDRSASLAAMRKVSELDSGDAGLIRNLAEAETAAGNFGQAVVAWKRLTVNAPGDVNAWNQLGYTLCWSGDYAGALAALREYARLRPDDANPLDSQGDVHYWNGNFVEAAASYAAAYAKTPGFLSGGELYKAAWAKFLAGDKTGADAAFGKFREFREKAHDPSIDLFSGDWLYRTGRPKEARALLMASPKDPEVARPPAIRTAVAAQLALWDLLAGDRAAAGKDITEGGSSSATPGELLIRFAAMPTASAAEWQTRAAHVLAVPQLDGIRSTALGYALILDGKKQAAIPVWEEIVRQAPGNDFFPRNILARLKGQRVEHPAPPDSVNLNQFSAVLDKL